MTTYGGTHILTIVTAKVWHELWLGVTFGEAYLKLITMLGEFFSF